jgi:hypothetical protein
MTISKEDLLEILEQAPKGATHYIDFRPGDYSNKTYAELINNEMHLLKTQSEMGKVRITDGKPETYKLGDI